MVIWRPTYAQKRVPFLQLADIYEVCQATTAWQCHLRSLAHLLRLLVEAQERRWPVIRAIRALSTSRWGPVR
jgi:hypothetical protein